MEIKKYKIRCREKGIIICFENELNKHNIVWKRDFNPEIYPMDRQKKQNNN